MSLRDVYRQKIEAQIEEQKANLVLLKARAKRVAAEGKSLGYEELSRADQHLEHVKNRFKELTQVGGNALAEIKSGVSKALSDLKTSTQKAAAHFGNHPATAAPARSAPVQAKAAPRRKLHARAKPATPRKKTVRRVKKPAARPTKTHRR